MIKILGFFLCVMVLSFGIATDIQALPIGTLGDADPYVGTGGRPGDNQDTLANVNLVIKAWNDANTNTGDDDYPLMYASGSFEEFEAGPDFPEELKTKTITWDGNYKYLSTKYDSRLDVFYIEGISGSNRINWSGNWALSHYRLWNPISVPDASIGFLLGPPLIIFGIIGRRKNRS